MTRLFCCLFVSVVSTCWSNAAEIVPSPETQSEIDRVAVQLGRAATQKEGLIALKRMEASYTNKQALIQQVVLYLRFGAKTEDRGYGAMSIMNKMAVDKAKKIEAVLPQLDGADIELQKIAADVLRSADKEKAHVEGVDFSIYENILRKTPTKPPAVLIRYMYGRNPQAAVVTIAKVCGQDVSEAEVAAKAKSGVKESVDYFAGRSEWWAHLYVAAMMEKEPYLRTPDLVKKLERDDNPLVHEKACKVRELMKSRR